MKYIFLILFLSTFLFGQNSSNIANTRALSFDGTDYDSVLVANMDSLDFSTNYGSISFWYYPDTSGGTFYIADFWSGRPRMQLLQNATNGIYIRLDMGGSPDLDVNCTSQNLTENQWYHFAIVFNIGDATDTLFTYLNGTPENTVTYNASGHSSGINWGISDHLIFAMTTVLGNQNIFKLDEYAHFESALTATQIANIYNNGVPTDLSSYSPKEWFRFETVYTDSTVGEEGTVLYFPPGTANDPTYTSLAGTTLHTSLDTTNFYVDADQGDDDNNGLSMVSAWATIAKVNASTFDAGDTIFFRTDDTWRETLTIPSSGSDGLPIVFTKYDSTGESGTNPIIAGSDTIPWLYDEGGNIWSVTTTESPEQLFLSGTWGTLRPDTASCVAEAEWYLGSSFTNVCRYSQDYTGNGAWVPYNATITDSLYTAPDGNTTAGEFNITGNQGYNKIPTTVTAATQYTFSCWIKETAAGAADSIRLTTNNVSAWNTGISGKFEVTSSWQRVSITGNLISSGATANIIIGAIDETGANDADCLGKVQVWGVQVVLGANEMPYIKTTSAGVTASPYYVYSASDPSDNVEISVRDYAISVPAATDYVTIKDITAQNTNLYNVYIGGATGGSDELIFDNVDSHYSYKHGYHSESNTNNNSNVTITASEVSYNGGNGIHPGTRSDSWVVSKNTVHHNCRLDSVVPGAHQYTGGIKVNAGDPDTGRNATVTVEYNEVYSNGKDGNDCGRGIWFDTGAEGTVRYNLVYDNVGTTADGINMEFAQDSDVYYNIVWDNGRHGINITQDVKRNKIYNNVCYSNDSCGITVQGDWGFPGDSAVANIVKNNISVDNGTELQAVVGGENAGVGTGNVYESNCLGVEGADFIEWGDGTFYSTYDAFIAASSQTDNNVEADPLFTSASGDSFWLQSTSPAINAGVNLGATYDDGLNLTSSWPSSVGTLDQDTYGNWEIGAYVYGTTAAGTDRYVTHKKYKKYKGYSR